TYAVTQGDVDAGEIQNTAVARADAPGSTPVTSDPSSVTVPFIGTEALTLVKTGAGVDANGDGTVTAGDIVRWSFIATNAGVTTLSGLTIVDPQAGTITCD